MSEPYDPRSLYVMRNPVFDDFLPTHFAYRGEKNTLCGLIREGFKLVEAGTVQCKWCADVLLERKWKGQES